MYTSTGSIGPLYVIQRGEHQSVGFKDLTTVSDDDLSRHQEVVKDGKSIISEFRRIYNEHKETPLLSQACEQLECELFPRHSVAAILFLTTIIAIVNKIQFDDEAEFEFVHGALNDGLDTCVNYLERQYETYD
jgi:hypothetical protein